VKRIDRHGGNGKDGVTGGQAGQVFFGEPLLILEYDRHSGPERARANQLILEE